MKERPILFSAPMVRALLDGTKTQTRRVMKKQPYVSNSNPPRFTDTEPGDIFICPDRFPTNEKPGSVITECLSLGSYRCMGQKEFAESHSPYGIPGDRLWVRETWGYRCSETIGKGDRYAWGHTIDYAADGARRMVESPDSDLAGLPRQRPPRQGEDRITYETYLFNYWRANRPSIHMPRWASRITLEVTGVRVERLNNCSEADAIAEGIDRIENNFGNGPAYRDYRMARPEDTAEWFSNPVNSYRTLWEQINGTGSWDANPWVWVVEFRRLV